MKLILNRFITQLLKISFYVACIFLICSEIHGQASLQVTILNGSSTTTCTDPIGGPDPMFRVDVGNTGWVTYPATTFCFTDLPNLQYENFYNCPSNVPDSIEVCFRAFEQDGFLCNIVESCSETICQNFAIPGIGVNVDYNLGLPNGLSSDGEINFNIALNGSFIGGQNDFVCDAIDLGTIPFMGMIGDGSLSSFNNFCATNTNDPNPSDDGGFGNDQAVWFSFSTDATPSAYIFINGYNDPEMLGDEIGLQIAIYESSNGTCTGNLTYLESDHDLNSLDQTLVAHCLSPNTTYFILVDAAWLPALGIGLEGYFGLEIVSEGIIAGADFRCDAEDFGTIPENGSVGTPLNQTNYCATDIGESDPSTFSGQRTVWYKFQAPSSGHVTIEAISDQDPPNGLDAIGLQIALYRSWSGTCFGLAEVESQYSSATLDEMLEVKCLTPGAEYWILIDGDGANTRGIFSLTVTDAGEVPPQSETVLDEIICDGQTLQVGDSMYTESGFINEIIILPNGCDSLVTGELIVLPPFSSTTDTTICDGESVSVGASIYFDSGNYTDVLVNVDGCDSLVYTNLTVLESVEAVAYQVQEASSPVANDGSASVNVNSGVGPFTYLWSNFATTQTITDLTPGLYCVTVTSINGCEDVSCISVLYPGAINVAVSNGIVTCNGGSDGELILTISDGMPAYDYEWGVDFGAAQGSGTIANAGESVTISGLAPGSNYTITVTDAGGLIIVTFGEILEPLPLVNNLDTTLCFGETLTVGDSLYSIDGVISENLTSVDGCDSLVTGTLTILDEIQTIVDLEACFGESVIIGTTIYDVTGPINEILTAVNGCDSLVSGSLTVLPENATTLDTTVCANESIIIGSSTYFTSGNYIDVLIAANGCDSTIFTNLVVLSELTVNAILVSEASALNVSDGVAEADAIGGAGGYSYLWSNASTSQQVNNLTGGEYYCVTVTDANGCTAEDCLIIYFPVNILSVFENDTLDCAGNTNGQLIFSAYNGQAPYNYTWQNSINTLNGNGTIPTEGGTATIPNLPPDIYTVAISDQWGNYSINIEIVEPEPIAISIGNQINATCFSVCDGSISIDVTGGTAPYQYLWSGNAGNTSDIDLLCAGSYSVTITDANNCTQTYEVTISEPVEFIAEAIEMNPVSCFGDNNGEASVTTNGNPISYTWSNNETTQTINNLTGGSYSVTVVNADNCTAESSIIINEPQSAISTNVFVETPISCNDGNDGEATIVVQGGTGFTYSWSNGNNNATANNLSEGIYYVTATDINGCLAMDSIQLVSPEPIQASFTTIDVNCPDGDFSGMILIDTITGGSPSYLFSLDGANFYNAIQFDNLTAGAYDIFIEDTNGCVEQFEETVGAPDVVSVNLGNDQTIRLGESITLEAVTTSLDAIFEWNPPDTTYCSSCAEITVFPFETTSYFVTVIDSISGCSATDEVIINVKKDRSVFIPNTFTPNFDGDNDVFKIFSGKSVSRINTFKIFNRWGSLLFETGAFSPDESFGWDGTFQGKVMDVGVYIYFAEIEFVDGERRLYKGDVTLLK